MGGIGSGRQVSFNKKDTTDATTAVDVRYFHKQGLLYQGASGSLSWSCNGHSTGSIGFRIADNLLILSYRHRRHRDAEWEPVEQRIAIDHTPCQFGDFRPWWRCPRCGQRVAVLYGAGKYYRCRTCHGLTYASQQESYGNRQARKAQKFREQLGGSASLFDPLPARPKGMHRRTYHRLWEGALEAQEASLMELKRWMGRLN